MLQARIKHTISRVGVETHVSTLLLLLLVVVIELEDSRLGLCVRGSRARNEPEPVLGLRRLRSS